MSASQRLSEDEHARWYSERGFLELRQLLFWRWDPLDVADAFPATADEYDNYVPVLLSRLRNGATPQNVTGYLRSIEDDAMGLSFNNDACVRAVGQLIVDWYDESISHWMDRQR